MKGQFVLWLFLASCLSLGLTPQLAAQAKTPVAAQAAPVAAAQAVSSSSAVIPALPVPRLVKYSGVIKDVNGKPVTGIAGLTFSVYPQQEGGSALWTETQNVQLDSLGRYTVLLGTTKSEGMPLELFSSGDPRWLGVRVEAEGEVEQARVLLVSVPYALKASDADTLGGKPASAYMLSPEQNSMSPSATGTSKASGTAGNSASPFGHGSNAITANYLAMFTNSSGTLGNSVLYQNGSGNIGIGYNNPTNAKVVIGAPSGGAVLNSSNLVDQDMFVTLTAPGASDKHVYFGPSTNTNLTLGVNNTEMMRITNSGNIGIGYKTPTNARVVIAAPNGGGVLNSSNLVDQDMFVSLSAPGASDKHAYFGPSTATNLTLGVGNTEMMRITSGGNVGIGTSTPDTGSQLDVETANFEGIKSFDSNSEATSVWAEATSTSGAGWGVEGVTASNASDAYGVIGEATAGTGSPIGVFGGDAAGALGSGVWGQYASESAEATNNFAPYYAAGTWGDGGTQGEVGVIGTADNSEAAWFANNSSSYYTLLARNDNATGYPFLAYNTSTGGQCYIDYSGNLSCTGSKNAVVPVDGGNRVVAMSAIESPQNWFEDAGSSHLSSGTAVVTLDPTFMETVNTEMEYQVFLTPYGDCKGLYVTDRTTNSFVVHELGGGTASVAFGYRIMALRKNMENIRFADHTKDREMMQRIIARQRAGASPVSHMPRKTIKHAASRTSLVSANLNQKQK